MPYYDDDGNEIDPTGIPVPRMCLMGEKRTIRTKRSCAPTGSIRRTSRISSAGRSSAFTER
ncbi:MAG: hypothetical protein IPK01_13090 [Acidobacteria bacterium]|nr:hypothetical protein [Acidobacteriota bacterium]